MLIGPTRASVRGYGRAGVGIAHSRISQTDEFGSVTNRSRRALIDVGTGFHAFVRPHLSLSGDVGLEWSRSGVGTVSASFLDVTVGAGISAWFGGHSSVPSARDRHAPREEAWTPSSRSVPSRRAPAGAPRTTESDGTHRLLLPMSVADVHVLSSVQRDPSSMRMVFGVDARFSRLVGCTALELASGETTTQHEVVHRQTVSDGTERKFLVYVRVSPDRLDAWARGASPRIGICDSSISLSPAHRDALLAFVEAHRERAAAIAAPAVEAPVVETPDPGPTELAPPVPSDVPAP